jgi:hypothetical protein
MLRMKFDNKDYEEKGPNVAPGSTSSGKRLNAHTLDVIDKVKGEVMDSTKYTVSPNGRTMTLTIHESDRLKVEVNVVATFVLADNDHEHIGTIGNIKLSGISL